MAGAALSAVLLAGCGGSGGSEVAFGVGGGTPPLMDQTISNVFDYISQLIANSDPIDINGLTLASDDNPDLTLVN